MKNIRANELVRSRVKSGLKLIAHSDSKCGFVSALDRASSLIDSQLVLLRSRDYMVWVVARLQVMFGLRISECLNITGNDIDKRGRIIISGLKGSQSRIVIDSELNVFWLGKKRLCTQKIFEFDRYYVYRLYKSVGICYSVEGKKKGICTHTLRHLFIKDVQQSTNDIEETAILVGHKATSSTNHYLKSKIK